MGADFASGLLAEGRSVWSSGELEADRSWRYEFTGEHVEELLGAADAVERSGAELGTIQPQNFRLPKTTELLKRADEELRSGRGFAVLGGFPVDESDLARTERLLWGLGSHLGIGVTQNSDATLIHYVTDGAAKPKQGARGVGSNRASRLHVDPTDYAALLCVRQATDEPASWVTSSGMLHNELLARRSHDMELLERGFHWDRMGEQAENEEAVTPYPIPMFSWAGRELSCRYSPYWIRGERAQEQQTLTEREAELLEAVDEVAHELRFEFELRPGDIELINNYAVLHGRAGHDAQPHEDRKRLLMRLWIEVDDLRPYADEAVVRFGAIRHGTLGWTWPQIKAGLHRLGHARDATRLPLATRQR